MEILLFPPFPGWVPLGLELLKIETSQRWCQGAAREAWPREGTQGVKHNNAAEAVVAMTHLNEIRFPDA